MSAETPTIGPALHPKVHTNVSLSTAAWKWLRTAALDRAARDGGRPSASAVLEELIRAAAAK